MKLSIITVGDELLIGQVIDTNSAWIAQQLHPMGWEVAYKVTVRDTQEEIVWSVTQALEKSDVVLVTGGLGPTNDDITKKVLCDIFGGRLELNQPVLEHIEALLRVRSFAMNDSTRSQAYLPTSCTPLHNALGTAPAMLFEQDRKRLIAMPGVPFEMKAIVTDQVLPLLRKYYPTRNYVAHRTLMVTHYTESALSESLASFEAALPAELSLAYLPSPGVIRLRLTQRSEEAHPEILDRWATELKTQLGEAIFYDGDTTLAGALGALLLKQGLTLGTAESCTGGNIAHEITSEAGASAYFLGGVVAYSNLIKSSLLDVDPLLIEQNGAVSGQVAEAMAVGACRRLTTDCAIATTGIAGPSGGTPEKPVGTVWIAFACRGEVVSHRYTYATERSYTIYRSTQAALLLAIHTLMEGNNGGLGKIIG